MAKKIEIDLFSRKSINAAIKQIADYKKTLTRKCEKFCYELAEMGIDVAKSNTGNYGKYIAFKVETKQESAGCVEVAVVASNTGLITSVWKTKDGEEKSVDVSPLLMCEFGSGLRAQNPMNVPKVGRGSFPGQTHANDPGGWYYMDVDGVWHHSYGVTPSAPMYKAYTTMYTNIEKKAREVFASNG